MAFTSTRGSIGATRGTLYAYASAPGVDWRSAPGIEVHLQTITGTAYIGGTDVTTVNGYSLGQGSALTVNVDPGETLCAISTGGAGGTAVLRTLKSTRD